MSLPEHTIQPLARYGLLATLVFLTSHSVSAQTPPGRQLYQDTCAHCHGDDGRGGTLGPTILERIREDSPEALQAFLRTGSPERGMPPTVLSESRMARLLDYLPVLASGEADGTEATDGTARVSTRPNRVVEDFIPVDEPSLLNPDPGDWLSFSRTPDAQRFSPLEQIDTANVDALGLAWSRGLPDGLSYSIPLVHDGVMYLSTPAATILALDAATGETIWEYQHDMGSPGPVRDMSKTLSIYLDMVYYTAPDATVVAIDARTGELRWQTPPTGRGHSSGSIVANGLVLSSGNCVRGPRDSCFVSAHDAESGELVWRFHTVQADDEYPGFGTWGDVPLEDRLASPWGLPGSYDPELDLVYWSVANPMPTSRLARHDGEPHSIGLSAPVNLYSNSTVALDPDTGELVWYYQHLPGDDWDLDMNQERILINTPVNPDPEHVKWINPAITPGERRDVAVNVGEGGGLWMLDRATGEFLWATPFPFDVENFFLSDIDVETGVTHINADLLVDEPGEQHLVCYLNTRSFWPTAYHPRRNELFVPYIRNCLDMTSARPATDTEPAVPESREGAPEPGVPEDELNGLARVDMETGEITHWPMGRIPTTSAMLVTAGDLVFWGDVDRNYRAMDVESGDVLWQTRLSGPISMSNISYEVDGRQYVAVIAGDTLAASTTTDYMGPIDLDVVEMSGHAALYVFALPE